MPKVLSHVVYSTCSIMFLPDELVAALFNLLIDFQCQIAATLDNTRAAGYPQTLNVSHRFAVHPPDEVDPGRHHDGEVSARRPSATMPSASSPASARGRHPHHGHAHSINRCRSLLGSTGPHRTLDLPPPVAPNMNTRPRSCRSRSRSRRSSLKDPDRRTTWIMDATTHHPEPPYRPCNILRRSPTPSPLPSSDDMPSHPDAAGYSFFESHGYTVG